MEDNVNLPKIKLTDQPWFQCECGGFMFESGLLAKKISSILSPSGKDELYPIDVLYCKSCGLVPKMMYDKIPNFPDALKAKTQISK